MYPVARGPRTPLAVGAAPIEAPPSALALPARAWQALAMAELLETLRALGKEKTAETYRRHGATGEVLGVSYADLGKLQKKHRGDHALAQELWKSGVHEARVLATQIAVPAEATRQQLESWLADLSGYPLTDALAGFAAQTRVADACMKAWMKSKSEWTASAGWRLLALRAMGEDGPGAEELETYLSVIESQIHRAQNRVRHQMNHALIAIGGSVPALEKRALQVAKAIGVVEVDHGDTSCETPDAASYIAKMKARRAKKKS